MCVVLGYWPPYEVAYLFVFHSPGVGEHFGYGLIMLGSLSTFFYSLLGKSAFSFLIVLKQSIKDG